jgi:selenophosphate synthase
VLPAAILSGTTGSLLFAVAILGWFTGLFVARMPRDLRQAGAYALRYHSQVNAYALLLTDRYPDATPRIE